MAIQAYSPPGVAVPAGLGVRAVAITPSDTTVYNPPLRAIWVGVAGNLSIMCIGDTTAVTLASVPAGPLSIACISRVMATGTLATTMIGFS